MDPGSQYNPINIEDDDRATTGRVTFPEIARVMFQRPPPHGLPLGSWSDEDQVTTVSTEVATPTPTLIGDMAEGALHRQSPDVWRDQEQEITDTGVRESASRRGSATSNYSERDTLDSAAVESLDKGGNRAGTPTPVFSVKLAPNRLIESSTQTEINVDGPSIEEICHCKICYGAVIDLVLGCGHPYCYECFNRFFHHDVLGTVQGNQTLARERLRNRSSVPWCPACKMPLPGQYTDPSDRKHLEGFYVALCCPGSVHPNCFIKDYMVQGNRIRHLRAVSSGMPSAFAMFAP